MSRTPIGPESGHQSKEIVAQNVGRAEYFEHCVDWDMCEQAVKKAIAKVDNVQEGVRGEFDDLVGPVLGDSESSQEFTAEDPLLVETTDKLVRALALSWFMNEMVCLGNKLPKGAARAAAIDKDLHLEKLVPLTNRNGLNLKDYLSSQCSLQFEEADIEQIARSFEENLEAEVLNTGDQGLLLQNNLLLVKDEDGYFLSVPDEQE